MPLIVISGLPASGKTTRTVQLKTYFEGRNKTVHVVSEHDAIAKAGFEKNEFFASSPKEKIVRADLKSEALRLLNNNDVVVLDAANYIKGYRYELYCASKAVRTTQCTFFCAIQQDKAWRFNERRNARGAEPASENADDVRTELPTDDTGAYTKEIFDSLCQRYEEPHGNNRWDSPLFTVFPEDTLDVDSIHDALFENKPPPPNKSTQCVSIVSNKINYCNKSKYMLYIRILYIYLKTLSTINIWDVSYL